MDWGERQRIELMQRNMFVDPPCGWGRKDQFGRHISAENYYADIPMSRKEETDDSRLPAEEATTPQQQTLFTKASSVPENSPSQESAFPAPIRLAGLITSFAEKGPANSFGDTFIYSFNTDRENGTGIDLTFEWNPVDGEGDLLCSMLFSYERADGNREALFYGVHHTPGYEPAVSRQSFTYDPNFGPSDIIMGSNIVDGSEPSPVEWVDDAEINAAYEFAFFADRLSSSDSLSSQAIQSEGLGMESDGFDGSTGMGEGGEAAGGGSE